MKTVVVVKTVLLTRGIGACPSQAVAADALVTLGALVMIAAAGRGDGGYRRVGSHRGTTTMVKGRHVLTPVVVLDNPSIVSTRIGPSHGFAAIGRREGTRSWLRSLLPLLLHGFHLSLHLAKVDFKGSWVKVFVLEHVAKGFGQFTLFGCAGLFHGNGKELLAKVTRDFTGRLTRGLGVAGPIHGAADGRGCHGWGRTHGTFGLLSARFTPTSRIHRLLQLLWLLLLLLRLLLLLLLPVVNKGILGKVGKLSEIGKVCKLAAHLFAWCVGGLCCFCCVQQRTIIATNRWIQ